MTAGEDRAKRPRLDRRAFLAQALGVPIGKRLGGRARQKVRAADRPGFDQEEQIVAKWAGIQKDGSSASKELFRVHDGGMEPARAIRLGLEPRPRVGGGKGSRSTSRRSS